MTEQLWTIRGERIVNQLNEVSTVSDLEDNIEREFPTTKKRQHATGEVTVQAIEYIPYLGMKMLHIRSNTVSNGNPYKQAIQLTKVPFSSQSGSGVITLQAADGTEFHAAPINLAMHNAKVRCNCMDFHYRFANYNAQDKSLVGKPPPPYVKKTNRPPVNPNQVPGLCKHLLKVVQQVQATGLILPS
jgi:hypothetical protein